MLADIHQQVEEFVDVGQVEIPSHHEVFRHPVVLSQKRVYTLDAVLTECSVTHVSQKQLTSECGIFLEPLNIIQLIGLAVFNFAKSFVDLLEDFFNGRLAIGSFSADVSFTRCYVEFDVCHTGAVLPAIVLLFQQQIHFIESVERRPVLFEIIFEWFFEAKQGYPALVLDRIAHEKVSSI